MKTEDERYEQWLEALKKKAPVLENPEALTEDILRKVDFLAQRNSTGRGWNICGWISAVAAGILVCLLVNDTIFFPKEVALPEQQEINLWTQEKQLKEEILPQSWSASMNLMEKSRYISDIWNKRQEKRKKETILLSERMMEMISTQSFNK